MKRDCQKNKNAAAEPPRPKFTILPNSNSSKGRRFVKDDLEPTRVNRLNLNSGTLWKPGVDAHKAHYELLYDFGL